MLIAAQCIRRMRTTFREVTLCGPQVRRYEGSEPMERLGGVLRALFVHRDGSQKRNLRYPTLAEGSSHKKMIAKGAVQARPNRNVADGKNALPKGPKHARSEVYLRNSQLVIRFRCRVVGKILDFPSILPLILFNFYLFWKSGKVLDITNPIGSLTALEKSFPSQIRRWEHNTSIITSNFRSMEIGHSVQTKCMQDHRYIRH